MANQESPAADLLVAIVVAARRAGDRRLERRARQELLEHHGMKVSFAIDPITSKTKRVEKGGDDAN